MAIDPLAGALAQSDHISTITAILVMMIFIGVIGVICRVFIVFLREERKDRASMLSEEREARNSLVERCHTLHAQALSRSDSVIAQSTEAIRECSRQHAQSALIMQQSTSATQELRGTLVALQQRNSHERI